MGIIQRIISLFADLIETIVMAMAVFVIVYFFLVQPHQVYGNSMLPNFHNGDYLLTDKISYRFRSPKRGDVIVFQSPTTPEREFIKRIIGLPGEKVLLKEGKIFINGKILPEPYLPSKISTRPGIFLKEGKEIVVPLSEYFVLGDNRNNSSDSRDFGTIPRKAIIGKVWLRYWPPSRLSLIPSVTYR